MKNLMLEGWATIKAVGMMIREFFVRWFLPLHTEEDPEAPEDRWEWEDPKRSADPPVGVNKEALPSWTDENDDTLVAPEDSPPEFTPIAAPPEGAEDRVSRSAIPTVSLEVFTSGYAAAGPSNETAAAPDDDPDLADPDQPTAPRPEASPVNPFEP